MPYGGFLGLAAASGRVVCMYYDPVSTSLSVRVFDATNGTLLWEAPGEFGAGEVALDVERVYFEINLELRAYDLESGQQLWESQLTPHRGHSFDPEGDNLYILESGGGGPWTLYTLDACTGDILSSESVSTDDGFILLARFPQFDLYYGPMAHSPNRMRAVDPATQQTRWSVEEAGITSLPEWPPVLLDDVLLIETGDEVIAFGARDGQVIWRSYTPSERKSLFATGSVIVDRTVYALRYDGRLVRLDSRTGQETGHIQFTPALPDSSHQSDFFALAADGQMLFISFDDSNELIAFGP